MLTFHEELISTSVVRFAQVNKDNRVPSLPLAVQPLILNKNVKYYTFEKRLKSRAELQCSANLYMSSY